jgi:hybrid cluster-associated redox disulfide protein
MIDIDKDTLVSDVLRFVPGGGEVFLSMGMHCLHCGSAAGETLEDACLAHDMDLDTLIDELESQIALYE